MMKSYKKFIAPGAWFSMLYPASWNEFEDEAESFLFYNPEEWTGNFRISAYRGNAAYGQECIRQELMQNAQARPLAIGKLDCAYSCEDFEEDGAAYTTHFWVTGIGDVAFECSFTVQRGGATEEAQEVIASLEIRQEGAKYPAETIPVRLSEIYQIDEAYDWVSRKVKDLLKKDFQGQEEDIASMQELVDKGTFNPKKREAWLNLGLTLCVILVNEVEALEWRTLVDGNREAPVLFYPPTGKCIDPMKLAWSKVKKGEKCDLPATYEEALNEL